MYDNGSYVCCNSGGKDSLVVWHLLKRSGADFKHIHNVTTIGYPEQMRYLRTNFDDIEFRFPEMNMRELIIKNKFPPMRDKRYCCKYLKERNIIGEFKMMGIRSNESNARKKNRNELDVCSKDQTKSLNPIFTWDDNDVWRYIDENNLNYCKLYDKGYNRIGCMLCPFKPNRTRKKDAKRYPGVKQMFINIFDEVIKIRNEQDMKCTWKDGEKMFDWWLSG